MKNKYRGNGLPFCIVFLAFAIAISLFYQHREELGKYKFAHHYYIHNEGIMEYSSSAIVSFPIKGDYSDLVGKTVYFYDNNKSLNKGELVSISLSDKKFVIGDTEYDTSNFLGEASGGVGVLGSVIDFLTTKSVYLWGIIVPSILCILYGVYVVIIRMKEDKK